MAKENEALGMDFKNLMSCIHYHEDPQDTDVILETLKTITNICSNESCGRDAFREEGGLDFLVEFLFVTDNTISLDHTLKTLAFVIDENVHSQMYLSKRSVFEVLQEILKNQSFPTTVQKNALGLVSTILYQNSSAQSLVYETGLLQDLLNMYEHYIQGCMINKSFMTTNLDSNALSLWMSANSALCFAVNNPQNEKNQDICKNIFPVSLRILEYSTNTAVRNSVASFLALAISDNEKCKDYFSFCDGFLVLKRCFQKYFDAVLMDMKICNGIIAKETNQAINNIIGIISSASLDHEKNASVLGDLGILSIMVKLLFLETLDIQMKAKIVLSLGHCIDACCDNKSFVLETENFDAFIKKSLQYGNAELSSACKYLLQICFAYEGLSENNIQCINESYFEGNNLKCSPEYSDDILKESVVLNGMDSKILSWRQSFNKVSSTQTPSLKFKLKSRSHEKAYSSSSSSHENTSQSVVKRGKAKIKSRSRNKLSFKKTLSDSNAVQFNHLSDQLFPSRDSNYSPSILSNGNLDSSKSKLSKKEVNQPSTYDKFSKQEAISEKLLFTDFLKNETKNSNSEIKDKTVLEDDHTEFVSESLISEWKEYNKAKQKEKGKLSTCSSDQLKRNFPVGSKLGDQKSDIEKCPKLFKEKKEKLSSKQSSNICSSSSSEYSFTPNSDKNSKSQEKRDFQLESGMPYQSKISPPEPYKDLNSIEVNNNQNHYSGNKFEASKRKPFTFINSRKLINFSKSPKMCNSEELNNDQNSCLKLNSDDKVQAPTKNSISFINIEKQVKKDDQSNFSCNLTPDTLKSDFTSKNILSGCQRIPKIGKENLLDLAKFASTTSENRKTLVDSGIPSDVVLQCKKRPNMYLGDCYQSVNWTVFPQTSRVSENPYNKKYSWSCASTNSCQESLSPFSSSLNSSRHVQVIRLPEETCEQHGLSKHVEMLEVVSLEDTMEG